MRSTVGKYRILQTLGSGAMGVVYLAFDPTIERRVAIKTIRRDALDGSVEADATARFRREAMAAGRLNHPGIVAVYDYGEEDDVAYIVMEYAPGLELGEYVARYQPSTIQIAGLMIELLAALGYAHSAGVVHRDIKPANVMVTDRVKVTDFGIARVDGSKLTQTGVAVGTPSYMAPEQFQGSDVDHRADLFAAGVVFYQLLTGAEPFDGKTLQELCYKIAFTEPVSPSALNASLPSAVDSLIAKALAKSPDARFASAAEFSWAIEQVFALSAGGSVSISAVRPSVAAASVREGAQSIAPTETNAVKDAAPHRPRSRLAAALGIAAVLAAIAVGAYASLQPRLERRELTVKLPTSPAPPSPAPEPLPIAAQAPSVMLTVVPPQAPAPKRERAPSKPRPPPAPRVDCDPPYSVDSAGRRIFKVECM